MERALFLGFNALGDTLCTTPVIRAYRELHPEAHISYITQHAAYTRVLDGNPDIDFIFYSEFLAGNGLAKFNVDWLYTLPFNFTEPSMLYTFDINQVCTTKEAFESHIAAGFSRLLKIPIDSIRPVVHLSHAEETLAASFVQGPYAVLSMHSNANPQRPDGQGNVKDWPFDRWVEACKFLRAAGIKTIISVAGESAPRISHPEWTNLYGLPIKLVASLLKNAACVITLENGIGHLAHGVDAPMVMIYSDIVPLGWANPSEATSCKVLYGDPYNQSTDAVTDALGLVMRRPFHFKHKHHLI